MVAQHERMAQDAAAVGLDFQWERLRGGNSYDAHRLIHLARALGREDEVTERVMRAWYTEGEAIGDHETLVRLATEAGLEETAVRDLLAGDDHGIDVRTDLALAAQIGITSVPTFVLDQKYGVSGAQPVEVLLDSIRTGLGPAGHRARAGRRGGRLRWRVLRRGVRLRCRGRGRRTPRMPRMPSSWHRRPLTPARRPRSGNEDTPRTWKSPPALAAFLPWGSSAGYHHAGCRGRS